MQNATGSALCLVTGGPGAGKTSWACRAAHGIAGSALRIDAARATRASGNVESEIRELLEDAALVRCPVVVDNADSSSHGEAWLASMLGELLDRTSVKLFVVLGEHEPPPARLAARALGHVCIKAPPPAARRELWKAARAPEQVRNTLANDLVLTPRQIANALALIEAGAEPTIAALAQRARTVSMPDRVECAEPEHRAMGRVATCK